MGSRVGRLALSKSPQTDSSLSRPEEHPPNPNAQSTSMGLQAQMAGRRLRDGYGFGPEYESGRHGKTPYRLCPPRPWGRRVGAYCQPFRSEEHTSELQSLMRNSYAVFCLKKKTKHKN